MFTFETQTEDMRDKFGWRCIILKVFDTPDEDHDEECLPMYLVRFEDTSEAEAFPEELGTEWICPVCGEHNVDMYSETSVPLCAACEKDFEWYDVIGKKQYMENEKWFSYYNGGNCAWGQEGE